MPPRIAKVAIKTPSGRVATAPLGKRHKDIPATGHHGFMTGSNKFVGRGEAAKIAQRAGQTKQPTKSLHSHNLRSKSK